MLLAGHITTDMQASCQTQDYVLLKALSNSTAREVAHPCSPDPDDASICTMLGMIGGWGEERDAAYLFSEFCRFLVGNSCDAELGAH